MVRISTIFKRPICFVFFKETIPNTLFSPITAKYIIGGNSSGKYLLPFFKISEVVHILRVLTAKLINGFILFFRMPQVTTRESS